MGFVGNAVKKSVKKLKEEFSRYKNGKNKRTISESDDENLYEDILVARDSRRNSYASMSNETSSKQFNVSPQTRNTKRPTVKPQIKSSLKYSLEDPLTSSSIDSGISEQSPLKKRQKKLQFSNAFIHEFERNTLERKSYQPQLRSSASIYKAKHFEVPSPQRVEIIERGSLHPNNSTHSLHYIDPCDLITTKQYALPVGTKSPPKPPRCVSTKFKRVNSESAAEKNLNNVVKRNEMSELGHFSSTVKAVKNDGKYLSEKQTPYVTSLYPQLTSSSSIETYDVEKVLSLSKKFNPNTIAGSQPIYAQITPRHSRNLGQLASLKYSTPISFNDSTPEPGSEASPCSSKTSLTRTTDSEEFSPVATSSVYNEIFTKETKESVNLIHQTNWSLKIDEVGKKHECQTDKKSPQKESLDKKFVVNMFESRPSKRWEKMVTDETRDVHGGFQKRAFVRMSLDSKMMETRNLENNYLKMVTDNFDEVEQNIEMLERESRQLEIETMKIKQELKRMLRKDNRPKSLNDNEETKTPIDQSIMEIKVKEEFVCPDNNEQYNKYRLLKKTRDVECFRMAQASKALEEIKSKKGKKDWLEVLVAEKILLETSERVKLLTQHIRDSTYTIIQEPPLHKGTLHLSNLKFPFSKRFRGNHKPEKHFTEFFLMAISYGTQIFISEFITGEEDPLSFQHEYTFVDVAPDFEIKVKLFCLKLRTSDAFFWEKFTCTGCCPTSRIIYEDHLTHQYQERTVFKTSFKLCAETTLTSAHINESSTRLALEPQVFDKLEGTIQHNFKCTDVDMTVSLAGFLDVGTLLGETYFWERKWCALKGPNLLIYNYPQDEDFGRPVEQINLEYCFGPIITKVNNCPKRRCFHLKTGRPNDVTSHQSSAKPTATLRTKPNFALRKFYFAARDRDEYIRWTVEVEKLLDSLSYFKKLVFDEEYDDCLRQLS